jgi:hypothetical protein
LYKPKNSWSGEGFLLYIACASTLPSVIAPSGATVKVPWGWSIVDLDRLSTGEKIVAGSGILIFILSFIPPWAKVSFLGESTSFNAWDGYGFLIKLGILLALVAAILAIIRGFGTNLSLPLSAGTLYLVLAGINALCLLLGVIIGPAGDDVIPTGVDISRGFLLFVGFALALVQTYGAWAHRGSEPATTTTGTATPPPAA